VKLLHAIKNVSFTKRFMVVVLALNLLGGVAVVACLALFEKNRLTDEVEQDVSKAVVLIKRSLAEVLSQPPEQLGASLRSLLPLIESNARVDYVLLTNAAGGGGGATTSIHNSNVPVVAPFSTSADKRIQ